MLTFALVATSETVSPAITGLFGLILVALIVCLALEEKLHAKKSLIAGGFACLCLIFGTYAGILSFDKVVVGSHQANPPEKSVELEFTDSKDGKTKHTVIAGKEQDPSAADSDHTHQTSEELHIGGHRIWLPVYIPGIDWSVIAIILGSSLFVDVTSKSGLFTWIAIRVTKASRGDPLLLLYFYGVMTVVFSAVLNNVTAMMIVGSLTAVSLDKLGRRDKLLGFLLVEALLTNVGGLLTLISSVPNIIVGTAADKSFVGFFLVAAPYVVVATIITLWLGARWFKIERLTTDQQRQDASQLVAGFDECDGVSSWNYFYFSGVVLGLFIITIAATSALPGLRDLGMGFVALAFATIMLIRFKSEVDKFYKSVDWDLLGFFMSLFVVIYVMEHALVLDAIGHGMQRVLTHLDSVPTHRGDAALLLAGSSVFSSVTDNIPLSAMLANILTKVGTPETSGMWWSVIFGANLGGNLTPIGSASTLVAMTVIHKQGIPLSFARFVKMAFPYAVIQIVLAILYVLFVVPWLPAL